jgi:phosphoribosylformylglycinamidine cyclo-ligase
LPGNNYRSAGVDLQAANHLKETIAAMASTTHGVEVLKSKGGFSGLYRLPSYQHPILASSTDGVGTKLKIASLVGHYESLGTDLVNLNVNDVITCGAKPLFFLDYISVSKLDEQIITDLLRGMAWGCRLTGCALIGGETAQAPGIYNSDDFDLAATVVGVVEEEDIIDANNIESGDVVLGLASSGIHTNGLSLARKVFGIDDDPTVLYQEFEELGHTLAEELLVVHRSYYPLIEPAFPFIKAISHVTGGGIPDNMSRIMPDGLSANLRIGAWEINPVFSLIQSQGDIDILEMYNVFNMGLGMILVCGQENVDPVRKLIPEIIEIGNISHGNSKAPVILDGLKIS